MINHENILYIRDLSIIGGVETYIYEMVKKYHDLDIAVVYRTAHSTQLKRLKKYCRTYRHTNQKINCKVAIINYDSSIIDYITKDIWKENLKPNDKRGIYQVIHADYSDPVYNGITPQDKRVKTYIGVTKHVVDTFKDITGNKNVIVGYNPLEIEKEPKKIVLLSATRVSVIKGKQRMIKLAKALDKAGINYVWYIFTNDTESIDSPNVVFMKPRLDIGYWFEQADYVVQLSDTEACSYTINEALYRNIPIIVTPLPYLEEIGVQDGKNAYIMKFDCSNIDEIVSKIENIPKFEFKHLKDIYKDILIESKSHYEEDKNMKYKVVALVDFIDMKEKDNEGKNIYRRTGDNWIVSNERMEELVTTSYNIPFVDIVEEIPEEKKVVEPKVEDKPKKTTKKK